MVKRTIVLVLMGWILSMGAIGCSTYGGAGEENRNAQIRNSVPPLPATP